MLSEIQKLITNQVMGSLSSNKDIPAEKKSQVVETTSSSIVDGLKSQFSSQGLSGIMGMLSGGSGLSSSSFTSPIESLVKTNLVSKTGLSPAIAGTISSLVVPAVMKMITKQSGDKNSPLSMESLAKAFGGDKGAGGLLGAIGGLLGG